MTFKQRVHNRYLQLTQDKIDAFRDRIEALAEDARNDAKGSAGDKHETALSMMQLEQEKLSYKLRECLEEREVLDWIDSKAVSQLVTLGSLVTASGKFLYLSRALPKIIEDGKTVFALSTQSPLGTKLLGLKIGEECEVNGSRYVIENIE